MRTIRNVTTAAALLAALAVVAPQAATASDGEQLYGLCNQCHGENGEGSELALAPAIAGLDKWYVKRQLENFRAGTRGLHPSDTGGLRMYPMSLTLRDDEDLDAVAEYVAGMPRVRVEPVLEGGDAARGADLYKTCAACHGENGAGIETMNGPALTGASDWYLLESLKKYKAGVRGSNPQNNNAVMMRGMAAQLADEQAMKDVIAHIRSLSD